MVQGKCKKLISKVDLWWNNISTIGIHEDMSSADSKTVISSNRLNIISFLIFATVAFFEVLKLYQENRYPDVALLRFFLLLGLNVFHIYLNSIQKFTISNASFLLTIPILLLLFPTVIEVVHNEYFFWYHYAPITFSIIPYFVFSNPKHLWIKLSILFYFILAMTIDRFLIYFSPNPLSIVPIVEANYFYYKFSAAMMFIFINASMYYAFSLNYKYSLHLESANKNLKQKSKLLANNNLQLKELNSTKDKLFRIIGHDLKNPIGTMMNFMNLLENHIDKIDRVKLLEIVSALKASSEQGFSLLEELLEWARFQTGSISFMPERIVAHKTISSSIELFEQSAKLKDIIISNEVEKNTVIHADKYMFATVFRNLIANAIKYTKQNGEIYVKLKSETNKFTFIVQDNGIGMPESQIKTLFNLDNNISRPGTANEKGTGLGLIICKEFVTKHNGQIWAENANEGGMVFYVEFPNERLSMNN